MRDPQSLQVGIRPSPAFQALLDDLSLLSARFESLPEATRESLLSLCARVFEKLPDCEVVPAAGARDGIGGLELSIAGIDELAAAAREAVERNFSAGHG